MERKLECNPKSIVITSPFWKAWRNKVAKEVIPYQWQVINDERKIVTPRDPGNAPGQEQDKEYSHAIRNLEIAAKRKKGQFLNFVFQDSDVYKWLEEAAFSLTYTHDKKLQKICDWVIDLISDAQQPDGYLMSPYIIKSTIFKNRKRFTQIHQSHEMYTMGHYIEAGIAYYNATGNKKALKIAEGMADCLNNNFGPEKNKIHGSDGHAEIELALAKLYEVTRKEKYLKLAKYLVEIRGVDPHFYEKQNNKIGNGSNDIFPNMRVLTSQYTQSDKPLNEQETAEGHCVRVCYLLTGAAHVARLTNDKKMIATVKRLWNNIVKKRMYITGSVGSTPVGEAFTCDYDLPNDLTYSESCASVALTVLTRQMMEIEPKGEYGDIIEKELFNSGISGIALDGKHFYYVNPLEADPITADRNPNKFHVLLERAEWFTCACCPSNIARYIAGVHRFIYNIDEKNRTIYAHQYIANNATLLDDIKVEQKSNFPWDGKINFIVNVPKKAKPIKFVLRIPSWSNKYKLLVNGKAINTKPINGLITIPMIPGTYKINLELDMSVKFMRAKTTVRHDAGKVAVMRGPVVYAAEAIDNKTPLWNYKLTASLANKSSVKFEKNLLEGVTTITIPTTRRVLEKEKDALYVEATNKVKFEKANLKLIPYYAWANRGPNAMIVWFDSDF